MKFKAYTGITWSLLELTGLIEDEDSHVHLERVKKHLGLHPFHLTNLHAALNEILSANLNSYDTELKGFPLAYKNPKVITPLGEVFYDTCFIHVDVEADFYVFRPQLEAMLKGVVNKKGLSHIGVLVHKAFNVSIPSPEDAEDWLGHEIEIGQEVKFTITHLDFNSRLPFIRGLLNEEEYLQRHGSINKSETVSDTEETPASKKSKSSNKAKRLSWMSPDETNDNTMNSDLEGTEEENLKRSKKASKKQSKKGTSVADGDIPIANSTLKKRKKMKKSKEICSTSENEDESVQKDEKPLERISPRMNSEHSEDQEDKEPSTPKPSKLEFNDSVPPESTERSSSKKRSKKPKLSDSDLEFDIDRVKADPETTSDKIPEKKVKSKKTAKNKLNDMDDSFQANLEPQENSKKSKKLKKSKSNSYMEENDVRVKTEEILYDGVTSKTTATPRKRRSKPKCPPPESDVSEEEKKPVVGAVNKQPKKLKEPNMVFDYDDVTVKKEKSHDATKIAQNGTPRGSGRHDQTDDGSHEQVKKPKKKSKKLARIQNSSDAEGECSSVKIKSEHDDVKDDRERKNVLEPSVGVTPKKKARKRSMPSNRNSLNDREESESDAMSKQHAKKRKQAADVFDFYDVEVKNEKSVETGNDNRETSSEEEAKISRSPQKKQAKKRRTFSLDPVESSPEIKVEK